MFKLSNTELDSKKRIRLIRKDADIHIANYFLTHGKNLNKLKIFKSVFLTTWELYSLSLFILRLEINLELQKRFNSFVKGFTFFRWGVKTWKRLINEDSSYSLGVKVEKEVFEFYLNRPYN